MHAFAGDSLVGAMPTEMSNGGTVWGNAYASEFFLICYISQYHSVFGASFSMVGQTLCVIFFNTWNCCDKTAPYDHNQSQRSS